MRSQLSTPLKRLLVFETLEQRHLLSAMTDEIVDLPGSLSAALMNRAREGYDQFYVYRDRDSGLNHYYPSWFTNEPTDRSTLTINTASIRSPGNTAIEIVWTGEEGRGGGRWNGVGFVEPESYVGAPHGQAYSLFDGQPAPEGSRLLFEARVAPKDVGDSVEFGFGGPGNSASQRRWEQLNQNWRQFSYDISGKVLSPLHVGFIVSANDVHDLSGDGVALEVDNIVYTWPRDGAPRLVRSYVVEPDQGTYPWRSSLAPQQRFDITHANTAYTYDQDVTLLSLLLDTSAEGPLLAKAVGNGLYDAWSHDWGQSPRTGPPLNDPPDVNHTGNRLYDAWMEGDPLDNQLHFSRPAGWTVGPEIDPVRPLRIHSYGMDAGVHFWTVLSMVTLFERTGDQKYLDMATQLAGWVVDNLKDPAGGFYIGFDVDPEGGWNQVFVKSTEMNTDGYVALRRLSQVYADRGDEEQARRWLAESLHAGDFVINEMYDQDEGRFYVGTTIDPETGAEEPERDTYVIDAQSWTILAFAGSPDYADTIADWSRQLRWAQEHLAFQDGGFDFGYDSRIEDGADGRWWEGDAGVALAYLELGNKTKYTEIMASIAHEFAVTTKLLMPASNKPDGLTTGFSNGADSWLIFERGHLAAHVWAQFAISMYNPFWDRVITWQNPWERRDVNFDGHVSPIDALIVINYLNRHGLVVNPPMTPPAPFRDTNDDRVISPIDALLVINYLNDGTGAESEPGGPRVQSVSERPVLFSDSLILLAAEAQSPVRQATQWEVTSISPYDSLARFPVPRIPRSMQGNTADSELFSVAGPTARTALGDSHSQRDAVYARYSGERQDLEEFLETLADRLAPLLAPCR